MKTFYVVGIQSAKQSDGIGLWTDGNTIYRDPIRVYDNIQEALKAGRENRQECILEVCANDPEGNAFLSYAEDLNQRLRISNAFAVGETTGLTQLYQPIEVDGAAFSTFTVAERPIEGCSVIPCRYRFLSTNEIEGRFTYYLNLLIAKTQKAGSIFLYDGKTAYTVKIGRFAFAPNGVGYEVPAVRYCYGNDDDLLYSVAFTANGRKWCCFRGLPQEVKDELGETFKKNGRSIPHLLRKVIGYWRLTGGDGYVSDTPSPYAVINVKLGEGEWVNLLP